MPDAASRLKLRKAAEVTVSALFQRAGFVRRSLSEPYRWLHPNGCEVLVFAKTKARHGQSLFEPIVAFENSELRVLYGEFEPRQPYPRFAHAFLGYFCDHHALTWYFNNSEEADSAAKDIADVVQSKVVPFAHNWGDCNSAQELVRRGLFNRAPFGIIVHPWPHWLGNSDHERIA